MSFALPTKTKILDAAEVIFAEQGISNSSLRSIVAKAEVNVAAVHYHFGSKEELIKAVFSRRISVVNESRIKHLDLLKKEFGTQAIPVRELLRAFIYPALQMGQGVDDSCKNFLACLARAHGETEEIVQVALYSSLKETIDIFLGELRKSCPNYTDKEMFVRLSFTAGAMVHTMLMPLKTMFVKHFFEDKIPHEEIGEMLVEFCAAGFCSGVKSDNE